MKKIFLLTSLALLSCFLFAQQMPSAPTYSSSYYLSKSKKQKKAGFILLGGFVAGTALSIAVNSGKQASGLANGTMVVGAVGGLGCLVTSSVSFISSIINNKKNKR